MTRTKEEICADLEETMSSIRRLRPVVPPSLVGLTPAEVSALVLIGRLTAQGKEVHPSNVAALMHVSKGALSQTIKAMEAKGFVTRSRSEADSRIITLALTPLAQAAYDETAASHRRMMADLVDYLGLETLESLAQTLRQVLAFQESYAFVEREELLPSCCHAAKHVPASPVESAEGDAPCA